MTGLWLPPKAQNEEASRQAALVAQMSDTLNRWDGELQQIDPSLTLVQAKPNATAPGLTPGYWHIVRHNPGAPPTLIVLEHDDGRFREPGGWMLELVKRQDLWNDRTKRDRLEIAERAERARMRAREREREDRKQEAVERIRHYRDESVLFSPDVSMKLKRKRFG